MQTIEPLPVIKFAFRRAYQGREPADAKAAVCFGDRQAAMFSWQKILIGKITQCLLQDKLVVPGDAYNGIAVRSSAV